MAQRRIMSMRARIWSAVACGSGGPPQARRSSAWMTPCGWPVRWLQAPTRPLGSFRSAARAWRLTGGAAGASGAGEVAETGVAGVKAGVAEEGAEADRAEAEADRAEAEGAVGWTGRERAASWASWRLRSRV